MKSRGVKISGPARRDLIRHRVFLEGIDERIAERMVADLLTKFYELASKGVEGSRRGFLPEELRAFPYKSHCFYFVVDNGTLTLVRVLSQRENVDDIEFLPESDC